MALIKFADDTTNITDSKIESGLVPGESCDASQVNGAIRQNSVVAYGLADTLGIAVAPSDENDTDNSLNYDDTYDDAKTKVGNALTTRIKTDAKACLGAPLSADTQYQDNKPLQGYDQSKGTIEQRLERLGFNQSTLDVSGVSGLTIKRLGYYTIAEWDISSTDMNNMNGMNSAQWITTYFSHSSDNPLFTLPEGYRPTANQNTIINGFLYNPNSTAYATAGTGGFQITIDTNGVGRITKHNIDTNYYFSNFKLSISFGFDSKPTSGPDSDILHQTSGTITVGGFSSGNATKRGNYVIYNDVVSISGVDATWAANTIGQKDLTLFTLPVNYRPYQDTVASCFIVRTDSTSSPSTASVKLLAKSTGEVVTVNYMVDSGLWNTSRTYNLYISLGFDKTSGTQYGT